VEKQQLRVAASFLRQAKFSHDKHFGEQIDACGASIQSILDYGDDCHTIFMPM